MTSGLLLIDIQNDYFPGGALELPGAEAALENAVIALETFRSHGLPVFHVQHVNVRPGATFFLPETNGVKIHERLSPKGAEFLFVKKTPNGFFETALLETLREQGIDHLVVAGMMTHMCVDTTVRAARDFGIAVTILEDACATGDLDFRGERIPADLVQKSFMASLSAEFAEVIRTQAMVP